VEYFLEILTRKFSTLKNTKFRHYLNKCFIMIFLYYHSTQILVFDIAFIARLSNHSMWFTSNGADLFQAAAPGFYIFFTTIHLLFLIGYNTTQYVKRMIKIGPLLLKRCSVFYFVIGFRDIRCSFLNKYNQF